MPGRAAKRRKLEKSQQTEIFDSNAKNGIEYFVKLPLELIAEILSYTSTPDILSLARTCRFFTKLLALNPSTQFIWKASRRRFGDKEYFGPQYEGLPQPPENWTEASYAAFLFDPAPCEVCHVMTKSFPFSYVLRARVCENPSCSPLWIGELFRVKSDLSRISLLDRPHAAAIITWLPHFEQDNEYYSYRIEDWISAFQQHKAATADPRLYSEILQEYAKKSLAWPKVLQKSKEIHHWLRDARLWQASLREHNIQFLRNQAREETWEERDFVKTTLYKRLLSEKEALYENLTAEEYSPLKDEFRTQVAAVRKKRIQSAIDEVARVNREDLRRYWNRLKTFDHRPFPPYGEFRRLEVSQVLLKKGANEIDALKSCRDETLWHELTHNVATQTHIRAQVNAWLEEKRMALAHKLGNPEPELEVAAGFIHPAERVTAWFNCTNCIRESDRVKPLDFRNVCKHNCSTNSRAQRTKRAWMTDWFVPDKKAIAVMKKAAQVARLDERVATMDNLRNVEVVILCKSCTSRITLPSSCLMRHCKRHEDMEIELLKPYEAHTSIHPPAKEGLVSFLLGHAASAKPQRGRRNFQCRHCQNGVVMTFDGLQSHLKSKHNIIHVGDEDVRVVDDINLGMKKKATQGGQPQVDGG